MAIYEYSTMHPKLLLAGEYTVLLGGEAISVPLKDFSVRFGFLDDALDFETARDSNRQLFEYLHFLQKEKRIKELIDLTGFENDLRDGLYLWSTVPYGYGLGSSGMVCASIYKTYKKDKKIRSDIETDLNILRKDLALMETYFHSKSSGFDPLACYLNKPVHVSGNEVFISPNPKFEDKKWFLLDSGIKRNTGYLVNKFMNMVSNHIYKQELEMQYIPFVNEMIERILHSTSIKIEDWAKTRPMHIIMEAISNLQLRYFQDMIPLDLLSLWQYGLDSGKFYLKLLGAGGGGYFLGYTDNTEETTEFALNNGFKTRLLKI